MGIRSLFIALILIAQNAPAMARLGLDLHQICADQQVEWIWLDAQARAVDPDQAQCDCVADPAVVLFLQDQPQAKHGNSLSYSVPEFSPIGVMPSSRDPPFLNC